MVKYHVQVNTEKLCLRIILEIQIILQKFYEVFM